MSKTTKIIIVGAGAAGLGAAMRIKEKGFTNFIVLEAKEKFNVGVNFTELDDNLVDLEVQEYHKDYIICKNPVFYQEGRKLDEHMLNTLYKIGFDVLFSNDMQESYEKPFGATFEQIFRCKLGNNFEKNPVMSHVDEFLNWFQSYLLFYKAAPNWFDETKTENTLLQGSNFFSDFLLKKFKDESTDIEENIIFNKEVSIINYNIRDEEYEIEIHCTDKSVFKANHVICALSLKSLKKIYTTLFDPKLSKEKENAIEKLEFEEITKIFLKFPQKWWRDENKFVGFLWNETIRENVQREFPQYVGKDGSSWMESIFGFNVVAENPPVLLVWVTGQRAGEVQNLSKQEILDACIYVLKQFLGFIYDIPFPEKIILSKWNSNPNFLEILSHQSMDIKTRETYATHLSEPIKIVNKNVILFAEKTTHPYYSSSVKGAIESGIREANRIITLYLIEPKRKVIIIGGGIAGLSAALTLLKHNIQDFVILEAEDRLGGRIKTVYFQNKPLEIGAQWIHGSGTTIYEISKKHGLLSPDISYEGTGSYVRDDGNIIDNDIVKWVDFQVGKILEECEHFTDTPEHPSSVGDYLRTRFLEILQNIDKDIDRDQYLQLLDWHLRFQNIDNSCKNLSMVSAKEWGKYSCPGLEGQEHINLTKGFQSLIDIIKHQIHPENIHLRTAVEKILWKDNNNSIRIACNNGNIYECDHVLVTCSLGVLKRNHVRMFEPPLPRNISSTIDAMGFDGLGKIFLIFEEKWWNKDGFQLVRNEETVVHGEESWTRYISGVDVVYNHPNVLLVWVGGEGVQLMEFLPKKIIGVHCVDLLRKFLKKDNIPYPVEVLRSSWLKCPYVCGGYSYSTPQNDEPGKDRSQLLEAVVEGDVPRILFAGEAVHLAYFSTVHGAFESGKSQTEKLLKYLNISN